MIGEVEGLAAPSYVIGPDGRPTAVVLDLTTWKFIVRRLEEQEEFAILRSSTADLQALASGEQPNNWKSWEDFEAELDELEEAGELQA